MRRVLICGSRDWTDAGAVGRVMIGTHAAAPLATVFVHGGARGADQIASELARRYGYPEEPHFADWKGRGRAAGPARNREMLESGVHEVWAFKDDFDWSFSRGGTENMVRIAREAGVPTYVVQGVR